MFTTLHVYSALSLHLSSIPNVLEDFAGTVRSTWFSSQLINICRAECRGEQGVSLIPDSGLGIIEEGGTEGKWYPSTLLFLFDFLCVVKHGNILDPAGWLPDGYDFVENYGDQPRVPSIRSDPRRIPNPSTHSLHCIALAIPRAALRRIPIALQGITHCSIGYYSLHCKVSPNPPQCVIACDPHKEGHTHLESQALPPLHLQTNANTLQIQWKDCKNIAFALHDKIYIHTLFETASVVLCGPILMDEY